MCLYSVQRPRSWACSAIGPAAGISSPSYSSTVSPLTRTRHVASFTRSWNSHHCSGSIRGYERALERVERAGGIVRTLHVVKLDLVAPTRQRPAGAAEHDAGVVMPDVPDVHLQLEIAERLVGGEVAIAIAVQHAAERLEDRLAAQDAPLGQIRRGLVERRPRHLRRQLAHAQPAEPDRVRQRLEPQVPAAEPVPQVRAPSRRRGLESPRRWSTPAGAASPSRCGTCSTRPCS